MEPKIFGIRHIRSETDIDTYDFEVKYGPDKQDWCQVISRILWYESFFERLSFGTPELRLLLLRPW